MEQGYDLDFVSKPPDSLLCVICLLVAKSPWQHGVQDGICGKLFCKSCLEDYKRRQEREGVKTCPHCRQPNPQYFPDSKSNREVLELVVKCEEAKAGCEWEGEIQALDKHTSTCPHVLIPCPRECEQGQVLRRDLESHLRDSCSERDYNCPHCDEPGRYRERVTSHLEHCPMILTQCPNAGCTEEICSLLVQFHVAADCEYTVLPCRYSTGGCNAQLPRRDLESHENNYKLHLKSTHGKISSLQTDLKSSHDKISSLQTDLKSSHDKISSLQKDIEKLQNEVEKLVEKLQKKPATLKDAEDSITFKITDCQKKKEGSKMFLSKSFYTSSEGYHMKIKVYANGHGPGKTTHLSVYVDCCEGDYDDTLSWPFIGDVTVTLLNQLEDSDHFSDVIKLKPETGALIGTSKGHGKFIRYAKLDYDPFKNTRYLMDDTLYFRVSVRVHNHKPWLQCTTLI